MRRGHPALVVSGWGLGTTDNLDASTSTVASVVANRGWRWDGQVWVPEGHPIERPPLRRRILALAILPGSALAVALWLWLMAETPSRSVGRYVLYWSTIVYVPGVMVAIPYRVLSRALQPSTAVLLVLAFLGSCGLVLAWLAVQALNSLTF